MASPQTATDAASTDATQKNDVSKFEKFLEEMTPDDLEELENEKWLNKKRVRAFQRALLIWLIEGSLPQEQRWMWYMLMLFYHEDLDPPLYVWALIPTTLLWFFPHFNVIIVLGVTISVDGFIRSEYKDTGDLVRETSEIAIYSLSLTLLRATISLEGMTEVWESLFGPRHLWVTAICPTLPGLHLQVFQERSSVNGFVPEGKQGILLAIFIRACAAILPPIAQWGVYISYSLPDWQHLNLLVEWLFCSSVWMCCGIPPHGAYALHLLVNQWPHPQAWFRHNGGGPSVILKRERNGTMWFIATCVVIVIIEIEAGPTLVETGYLNLPPQIWLPVVIVFILGIYFLRYGIGLRLGRYRHRPLEAKDTIRLLRLRAQPNLPNSPVQCDIIHSNLHNPPPYIAVSHRWAPPGNEEIILIDGAPFLVSPNIYEFLVAKRSTFHHVILWIDSICIDQRNSKEKSRQVGMMKRIFEEASCTIGWLGDEPGAEKAFSLLESIGETPTISNYNALLEEKDAGWSELRQLVANGWFERVWIIQEIAVSRNIILRYGKKEVEWITFANDLFYVLTLTFMTGGSSGLEESCGLLNALIMENIRIQVEDYDYLKLKDTLKLGLRFKATLPIDKVYGLLGIVEERYVPPFHPKYSRTDSFKEGIDPSWYMFRDLFITLHEIQDILGTLSGSRRTRTGLKILSSGSKGVQHLNSLAGYFSKITRTLPAVLKGVKGSGTYYMRPDYSETTTPELVYTTVARDMINDRDPFSFLCHAGISLQRNSLLANLPSWVPDWSIDPDSYLLPYMQTENQKPSALKELEAVADRRKASKTNTNVKGPNETEISKESNEIVLDAGPIFLSIKARIVGPITHLAILSEGLKPSTLDNISHAKKDFHDFSKNYINARALAREQTQSRYPDQTSFDNAFQRTTLADTDLDGKSPASQKTLDYWNDWTRGMWEGCPVLPALQPKDFEHFWSTVPDETEQMKSRSNMCKEYLFRRRMQSSANTKFAHLVRTEIAPSFAKYRWQAPKKDGRDRKEGEKGQSEEKEIEDKRKKHISMLDDKHAGPLAGYAEYIDYTIGRKLAITDSGHMGLVPDGAEEGDLVVFIERENLFFTLRQENRVEKGEGESEADEKTTGPSKGEENGNDSNADSTSCDKTFRLVGQSYIHDLKLNEGVEKEEIWFKVW